MLRKGLSTLNEPLNKQLSPRGLSITRDLVRKADPPAHPGSLRQRLCRGAPSGDVLVRGLIPSAQRLVWAAKQALGKAALGALFA